MKRFRKRMIWAIVGVLLLSAAAGSVGFYASRMKQAQQFIHSTLGDNLPESLMGTDDTEFHTVAKSCDYATVSPHDHPVCVSVQVQRLYGLHIGTPVKVRLIISSLTGTKVSFDTLMAGVLSRDPTTWRMVGKPVLVSESKREGFSTRVLDLVVAVWEPPSVPPPPETQPAAGDGAGSAGQPANGSAAPAAPPAPPAPPPPPQPPELWPFSVEFLYATDKMANGLDQWDYMATPPVKFGFAPLFDEPNASEPDLGPAADSPDHINQGAVASLVAGSLLFALGFFYWLATTVRLVCRLRVPLPPPAEVTAYRKAMARADRTRTALTYMTQQRHAVRDFLGGASKTDEELEALWRDHPQHDRIIQVLRILDNGATYGWMVPSEAKEVSDLMEALIAEKLKPSPESGVSRLITRLGMRQTPQEQRQ